MAIILSFLAVLGGIGLYFILLSFGVYRLYPVEMYALMAVGVILAWRSARKEGGWWRYAALSMHSILFLFILSWTLWYSRLPVEPLPVAVGQEMPAFSLPTHEEVTFNSENLRGTTAALFIFYRGDW